MSSSRIVSYRRAIALLEKWPKDSTKEGRDLGEHLRRIVAKEFPSGELSENRNPEFARQIAAFERLASDQHLHDFPRVFAGATSFGLDTSELKILASSELHEVVTIEESMTRWQKGARFIRSLFSRN